MRDSGFRSVLLGVLASLLILAGIEAAIRVVESVRADAAPRVDVNADSSVSAIYSAELGWERKPGFKGTDVDGVKREFDAQGYFKVDSANVADQTHRKVIFIGDSTTYGFGTPPSRTFAKHVGELVPNIDTINLGVIGYTSWQGRKVLAKYLPLLHPAVVVVSFNFNDRREIYPEDTPDSSARFEKNNRSAGRGVNRINDDLERLRFYRLLERWMRRARLLRQPAQSVSVDRLRPRVDENGYRQNLSDIANQTRQAGVPLIFVVLGDNPLQAGFLNKGIDELHAGKPDAAVDYFGIIAQSGSWFADLARVYLAKAYEEKNDPGDASRILLSSDRKESIQGGRPIRLDTTYNEIMREVARENHVRIVEAAAAIDQDPYVYIDHCHFNELGHQKVAELLAPQVADALRTGGP